MAMFPAFINVGGGSAELTDIPNVAGTYSATSLTISATVGDYVVLVAAAGSTTHTAPTITGATLIGSNSNIATGANIRYVYLYKATATTVTATNLVTTDRIAMFTLH